MIRSVLKNSDVPSLYEPEVVNITAVNDKVPVWYVQIFGARMCWEAW